MKEYINANRSYEVRGTSDETKPIGKYPAFTIFHEMDTGIDYYYDEADLEWKVNGGGAANDGYDMVIEAEWQDFVSPPISVYEYTILSGTYAAVMSKLRNGYMPRVVIKFTDYMPDDDISSGMETINKAAIAKIGDDEFLNLEWKHTMSAHEEYDASYVSYLPTYTLVINSDNEIVYGD